MSRHRSPVLDQWLVERRRVQQERWDAATPDDWECLESALVLLSEQVDRVVAAGVGPVHVLDRAFAHLTTADEFTGVVDRYVWGRQMRVEDDWARMPRWSGWLLSSFDGVAPGTVRLDSRADDDLDYAHLAGPRPWGPLRAFVPPYPLSRPALEAYQVICADVGDVSDPALRLRFARLASSV